MGPPTRSMACLAGGCALSQELFQAFLIAVTLCVAYCLSREEEELFYVLKCSEATICCKQHSPPAQRLRCS